MSLAHIIDRYPWLAGSLLFVGGVQFLLILLVSTALYPNYNINLNYISDLGATCRESGCITEQPSSNIFNSTVFLFGLLSLGAFTLIAKLHGRRIFTYLGLLSSIGAMGVGIFTERYPEAHEISAALAFGAGALAAIAAYRYVKSPFNVLGAVLGTVAAALLATLGLVRDVDPGSTAVYGLGFAGLERLLAYSIVLWEIGFGAYLMNGPLKTIQA